MEFEFSIQLRLCDLCGIVTREVALRQLSRLISALVNSWATQKASRQTINMQSTQQSLSLLTLQLQLRTTPIDSRVPLHQSHNQSINQSIKTHLCSAMCRKQIRDAQLQKLGRVHVYCRQCQTVRF